MSALTASKRSLSEVIAEFDNEWASRDLLALGLAVGFEDRTKFIFAGDDERLRKLERLVIDGGEPIGMLAFSREGRLEVMPLREFAGEDWALPYLQDLMAGFTRALEASGFAKVVRGEN